MSHAPAIFVLLISTAIIGAAIGHMFANGAWPIALFLSLCLLATFSSIALAL